MLVGGRDSVTDWGLAGGQDSMTDGGLAVGRGSVTANRGLAGGQGSVTDRRMKGRGGATLLRSNNSIRVQTIDGVPIQSVLPSSSHFIGSRERRHVRGVS